MNVVLTFIPALMADRKFQVLDTPPLALYVLAAALKTSLHKVTVVDPCEFLVFDGQKDLEKKCIDLLLQKGVNEADFVAFSSNSFNWGITKKFIAELKRKNNKLNIAAGGLHPSKFDVHAIESFGVDFVLRGEGEKTLPLLLESIQRNEDLSNIGGLTYRNNGVVVRNLENPPLSIDFLEDFPLPEYRLIPDNNPYTAYPVESSRGCAYSCAFCSIPHRHNWRGFSVDNVIKRVEHLYDQMGEKCKDNLILFVDDCFTINTKRAIDILRKLYQRYRYDFKYFLEVRISNILNDNLLAKLPIDSISSMQIGVECGYDEGLKRINKKITIKQLIQALNLIKLNGYASKCFLSFIIGFPWEREEEINMTLDTVQRLASMYHVTCNVNWLFLLPSDLWEVRKEYSIFVEEDIFDDPFWLSSRELFDKIHPLVSRNAVMRVEARIDEMREKGLPVVYNSAPSLKKV